MSSPNNRARTGVAPHHASDDGTACSTSSSITIGPSVSRALAVLLLLVSLLLLLALLLLVLLLLVLR
jgi:hypothetical protein